MRPSNCRSSGCRLGRFADKPVGQLAHGQRQWVELGLVLCGEPNLILLDEPAAGMTEEERGRTAEIIREINRAHPLIVVEHDMSFIRTIARRITVFDRGSDPDGGRCRSGIRQPGRARCLSGQAGRRVILEVNDMHAGYGRIPVLSGISFSVGEHEVVGVLGHNGMGKTTLLKALIGQVPLTAGTIRFAGADVDYRAVVSARARRHRLRAAGPCDFPEPNSARQSRAWASSKTGSIRKRTSSTTFWRDSRGLIR